MRKIWHWDRETRELVEGPAPAHVANRAPSVWRFTPFVSQATGRVISDNSQLREDLRVSGCRVKEPSERLNMPPVNPKNASDPRYDPDFSKEWYKRRVEAVRPEPESPEVQKLIDSMPPLAGPLGDEPARIYRDPSVLHANPHEMDTK